VYEANKAGSRSRARRSSPGIRESLVNQRKQHALHQAGGEPQAKYEVMELPRAVCASGKGRRVSFEPCRCPPVTVGVFLRLRVSLLRQCNLTLNKVWLNTVTGSPAIAIPADQSIPMLRKAAERPGARRNMGNSGRCTTAVQGPESGWSSKELKAKRSIGDLPVRQLPLVGQYGERVKRPRGWEAPA